MTVHHRRIAAIVSVVTVVAAVTPWAAGPAHAGEVTLRYQCRLSGIPAAEGVTMLLDWSAASSVPVGQGTPITTVHGMATTMDSTATNVLHLVGAATVEGTLNATGVVHAPEGDFPVTVPVQVPPTKVPASGPITITGNGSTPVFVFHRPGHATITADSGFTVHIMPRDGSGNANLGAYDASCALDSGQNNVLTSFDITGTADGAPAVPAQPTVPGPTASGAPPTDGPTATTGPDITALAKSIARRLLADPRAKNDLLLAGLCLLAYSWWRRRRRRH